MDCQECLDAAHVALVLGRLDVAKELLMHVVRVEPTNGEAWHLLGQVLRDPAQQVDCDRRARELGYVPQLPTPQLAPTFERAANEIFTSPSESLSIVQLQHAPIRNTQALFMLTMMYGVILAAYSYYAIHLPSLLPF